MNTKKILLKLAVVSAVVIGGASVAQAATQYGTGNFNWDAGFTSAWSIAPGGPYDAAAWANGNDAVLEGTAGAVSIDAAGVTAQSLTFQTAGFTVQNNTLTLSGTPVLTANADATISATVAGTPGFTKDGTATLTLLGTSAYLGPTSISAGMLRISSSAGSPSLNAATYTIGGSATLYLDFASIPNGQQSYFNQFAGSGLLRFNTATKGDYAGNGGQWYPNFGAGFTGTLQLDRGRIPTQGQGSLGGTTAIVVKNGAQLGMWNSGTFTQNFAVAGTGWGEAGYESSLRLGSSLVSGNVTLADATTLAAEGTATLSGVISGASTANLSLGTGSQWGTLVLTGSNTYTGATAINAGTLQLGNGGTTGALSPASAITDNGTLKFNRADTVTQGTDFGTAIAGSGGIVQSGPGTLVLNGINSYSGTTAIDGGTLKLAPAQAFRYYRFHVTANNGTDGYNQVSELHFYSNGVWIAAVGGSPATDRNNGENHWNQSNDNNAGTKFGQDGVPYDITYDFGSPQSFDSYNWATANDSTPARNPARWMIQVSDNGAAWTTLVDMTASVQGGPNNTFTWAGTDPAHYLAVDGAQNGGAAYAYPLSRRITSNILPMTTPVRIAPRATLDLNGISQTIASLADGNGGGGSVTNSAGTPVTLTLNQAAGEMTFNGMIADNGSANAISVVKSGAGTAKLVGNSAYTGPTLIEGGTLKLGSIAPFRYYKFLVNSVFGGGGNGLQYSEMAFYSSGTNPGNGTRVFPVTATGDGGQYGDQGLPGLYDGNVNTKSYMGAPFPRFVTYDFGTPTVITGYDWASANDETPVRNPNDWTVLGSNDGTTWTTLDTRTGAGGTPTATYTYAAGWPVTPLPGSLQSATSVQIAGGAVLDLDGNVQSSIAGLSGSGLVTNGTLFALSGTIAPGGTAVIGTLTVAVHVTGTAKLLADVAMDGTSDLLAVQGDVTLSGMTLEIANPGQLDHSKQYTVLTYSGTRTGKFVSVTVPDSRWHVIYPSDGTVKLIYISGTMIMVM